MALRFRRQDLTGEPDFLDMYFKISKSQPAIRAFRKILDFILNLHGKLL